MGFKEERFQGSREVGAINAPYKTEALFGAFKARVTGKQHPDDNQYIQINFNGQEMYARPCYNFGSRISIPSEAWLDKFKNEIFIWVVFEEGEFRSPVWLGWCFNEGKQNNLYDFPDSDIYKTEKFEEVFNDKTNEYWVKQTSNKKQEIKIGDTSLDVKAENSAVIVNKAFALKVTEESTISSKSLKAEFQEDVTIEQQNLSVSASNIKIGSEQANQPVVLGTELNTTFTELLALLTKLNTALISFSTAQNTASVSVPILAPLSPGYATLLAQVNSVTTDIANVSKRLTNHISTKIFVE